MDACLTCDAYILGYTPTDRGVKSEWECRLNLGEDDCPKLIEQEEE